MNTPKIVITIEGGIIQSVASTEEILYIVIDKDLQSEEEILISEEYGPDELIFLNEYEAIKNQKS